jgi:2C-methyl-D-erythritol 2,4-cyclodiphosphate synthase
MKCIRCNYEIKLLHEEEKTHEECVFENPDKRMWLNGVVGTISAGYGSNCDGDIFTIAICDDCIRNCKEQGIIAYTGNYMFKGDDIKEEIDKYRKLWRRNNNLDELL